MNMWIIFIIIYSFIVSFYETSKKKSTEIDSVYHVFFYISLLGFIFTSIISRGVFDITLNNVFYVVVKSMIAVIAWYFGIYALKRLPLGVYGLNNAFRVVFTVVFSSLILGEILSLKMTLGILVVVLSLITVNYISYKNHDNKKVTKLALIALLCSSFFASFSEIMDKIIMHDLTVDQMQFWFLFFNTIFSGLVLLLKKKSLRIDLGKGNYWLIIAAFCLVIGDRFMFMANKDPNSVVSIMTVLKQLYVFMLIIIGKILYKEKNILIKMLCFLVMIAGLIIIFI